MVPWCSAKLKLNAQPKAEQRTQASRGQCDPGLAGRADGAIAGARASPPRRRAPARATQLEANRQAITREATWLRESWSVQNFERNGLAQQHQVRLSSGLLARPMGHASVRADGCPAGRTVSSFFDMISSGRNAR